MLRTRLIAGVTSGFVMSCVFATGLTFARFGETFIEPLRVEPSRPSPLALRLPRTALPPRGATVAHTPHAAEGAAVAPAQVVQDERLAMIVRAYERERRPPAMQHLAAHWLTYFLITLLVTTFLRHGTSKRGTLLRTQVALLGMSLCLLVAAKLCLLTTTLPVYFLPVAAVPLLTALYLDLRTALVLSAVLSILTASLVGYDPTTAVVFATGSVVAAISLRDRKHTALLLASGLAAGWAAGAVHVVAKEVFEGSVGRTIGALSWESGPVAAFVGALLSGPLALLAHAPVSRLLGVVSRGRLLDLTDLDHPMLKKMASQAPGSWEHSRAMANLAEAAAASIHADALLTRVGAYYHDLGKTCQPKYFVENLGPDETTPHDELDPEVSADAIMAHVVEGTRILREGGIPEPVVEFAYTHHGTSIIEFFWGKCLDQGNPKELTEDAFRYPGMRPRTRETAILMLVDSIEAAARTVDPPTRKKFEEMVQRVVYSKLRQGQLDQSGLTMQELRTLTAQLVDTLCSAYHSRIRYPWQEEEAAQEKAAEAAEPDKPREERLSTIREAKPARAGGSGAREGHATPKTEKREAPAARPAARPREPARQGDSPTRREGPHAPPTEPATPGSREDGSRQRTDNAHDANSKPRESPRGTTPDTTSSDAHTPVPKNDRPPH